MFVCVCVCVCLERGLRVKGFEWILVLKRVYEDPKVRAETTQGPGNSNHLVRFRVYARRFRV